MKLVLERELALRYLEGKCSAEEVVEVERLLHRPENQIVFEQIMSEHWLEASRDSTEATSMDHVLEQLHIRIAATQVDRHRPQRSPYWQSGSFSWYKIAAVILVGVVASATLFYFNGVRHDASRTSQAQTLSAVAEVRQFTLPDGTKVWLNAGSTVSYDGAFSLANRDVYLSGEAFFDVTHNPKLPLIVHALDLEVRVLGTAFNVKSYPGDDRVETTLVRGKVLLQSDQKSDSVQYELIPNERAVYSHTSKNVTLSKVNVHEYTGWTQPPLLFEESPISDVLLALEKRYAVNIHISNSQVMNCRLTAQIRNESLVETLELLKSTTSITYEVEGTDVFITGNLCD